MGTTQFPMHTPVKNNVYEDPSITRDDKTMTWDRMNSYPKKQIKKFFTKKLIKMDEWAVKQILSKIEKEKAIESAEKDWKQQNRHILREKLRKRHEDTIRL